MFGLYYPLSGKSFLPINLLGANMDYSPSSPLVAKVQMIILANFDVSVSDAHDHAGRLVAMAARWNGADEEVQLPWEHLVKKDLGNKLRWKSEAEHEKFRREEEQWRREYDFLYGSPPRA
jgi:hypothetical protein